MPGKQTISRHICILVRVRGFQGSWWLRTAPAFKTGYESLPMANIDLYDLLARILGLEPAPNDGDLQRVIDIFDPGFLSTEGAVQVDPPVIRTGS